MLTPDPSLTSSPSAQHPCYISVSPGEHLYHADAPMTPCWPPPSLPLTYTHLPPACSV